MQSIFSHMDVGSWTIRAKSNLNCKSEGGKKIFFHPQWKRPNEQYSLWSEIEPETHFGLELLSNSGLWRLAWHDPSSEWRCRWCCKGNWWMMASTWMNLLKIGTVTNSKNVLEEEGGGGCRPYWITESNLHEKVDTDRDILGSYWWVFTLKLQMVSLFMSTLGHFSAVQDWLISREWSFMILQNYQHVV